MTTFSNNELTSAEDWQEFGTADFGPEIDIRQGEMCARMIVLKEYGDLRLRTKTGKPRILTGLPAGYVHLGQTQAILPGQSAALVVYW